MGKTIKIVTKAPLEEPVVKEIEHSLSNLQAEVQGLLTTVVDDRLEAKGMTLFANDEGILLGMGQNFLAQYQQTIVGPVVVTAHNDEGETVSLTDEQIETALQYFKRVPKPIGGWLG